MQNRGASNRKTDRLLISSCFLFGALLFQLMVRLEVLQTSYQLASFESEALRQDKQVRKLSFDLSQALDPAKIIEISAERLALRQPDIALLRPLRLESN